MISITITTSNGNVLLSDAIENFRWSVRNVDGLPFVVSMPEMIAEVLLHTKDVSIEDVEKGDACIVRGNSGLAKIYMQVVSKTLLVGKGKAEIALAGMGIEEPTLGRGVYDLRQDFTNNVVTKWSVRAETAVTRNFGHGVVNRPEDLLMAYLWGSSSLLQLSQGYFTGAQTGYNWHAFKEGSPSVPNYMALPEDILSFDVSPANPVVTELRMPRKIIGEADPAAAVRKSNQTKSFFIDGTDIAAVYTIREDVDENIIEQILTWSDGHVTNLGVTSKVYVVGIFEDSYLIAIPVTMNTDNAELQVWDKFGQGALDGGYIVNDWRVSFQSENSMSKTITSMYEGKEIVWVNEFYHQGGLSFIAGITKDLAPLIISTTSFVGNMMTDYYSLASVKQFPGGYISLVFAGAPGSAGTFGVVRVVANSINSFGIDFARVVTVSLSPSGPLPMTTLVVDAWDDAEEMSSPRVCVVIRRNVRSTRKMYTFFVEIDATSTNVITLEGQYQFVNSGDTLFQDYTDVMIVGLAPYNTFNNGDPLYVYESLNTMNVVQSIEAADYLLWGGKLVNYFRHKNMAVYLHDTDPETGEHEVSMFNDIVPWSARLVDRVYTIVKLNEGRQNDVGLPFIVANVNGLTIPTEDKGRITVSLMAFRYSFDTSYTTVSVQNLDMPALMSYIDVRTSYDEPFMRMKITGIEIEYGGLVTMRLHGILVSN